MKKNFLCLFVLSSIYSFAQQTFSWSTYPAASTASFSVTSGCLNMTSTISTVDLPTWQSSSPTYINTTSDGTGIKLNVNWANTNSSVTLQLDFKEGSTIIATPASFSLYNVNATGTSALSPFIDSIIIRGTTLSNTIINPTSITSDVDNLVSNPSIKGHQNGAFTALPSGSPETVTNIVFGTAVKKITITYTSGKKFVGTTTSIGSNPMAQYVTIGTINTNYTAGGCAVLSTISKFDVLCNTDANMLSWESNDESNASSYSLERSIDGQLFEPIYSINRNNELSKYSFSDYQLNSSVYYYRLKVLGVNGTSTYSSIITANCKLTGEGVKLFPNPTTGLFTIKIDDDYKMQVINLLGEIVAIKNLTSGEEIIDLQLQPGIYTLNLISNKSKFITKKLIVN